MLVMKEIGESKVLSRGFCIIGSGAISEDYSAFHSASESNKQNPRDRTLDLPFFFRYKHTTSLENQFSPAQGETLPYRVAR